MYCNAVACRYNVIQYGMILHTPLQEWRQNINQGLKLQLQGMPIPRANRRAMGCILLLEIWPCYNGTALCSLSCRWLSTSIAIAMEILQCCSGASIWTSILKAICVCQITFAFGIPLACCQWWLIPGTYLVNWTCCSCLLIEAVTKWPSFCRQHFKVSFSWMKIVVFWLHWNLFSRVHSTESQHWFR